MIIGLSCVFLSIAAFVTVGLRMCCAEGWPGFRASGQTTEADLASLFIFVSAGKVTLITSVSLIGAVGALWLSGAAWPAWVVVAGLVAAIPRVLVRVLRARRNALIAAQLPDALALWAGLLRSGQGLSQSLGQVAARQPAPLKDDLGMLLRQYRVGIPIERAVDEWRARAGVNDLSMLSTLLRATRELGGNLAESLSRLADVMRSRMAMEARIRALTSQGKLQGLIVGLLPVMLLAVLGFMEPDAMRKLYQTHQGWAALGAMFALEATGFVLIRRIVSIEV
ncbi:MAG: type II secretion system F family protein [Pseudomonadota bacterium]